MKKLDNRDIILNETFLIPIGSVGSTTCKIADSAMGFVFIFNGTTDPKSAPEYSWEIKDNVVTITFTNWADPQGLVTTKPLPLFDLNNIHYGFTAVDFLIAKQVHYFHFQLLSGGNYE
ncbi:MAG: hypothetical protein HZB59_02825 [Ignavibacteriales bacterium]|nr:hypothetical protein [Ignavibacteriales bacterium]